METDQAIVGSLDMTDGHDRGMVRRAFKSNTPGSHHLPWGTVPVEQAQRYIKALDYALKLSIERQDQRGIKGCVETLATIIGQQEARAMFEEKNARLDEGKATEGVAVMPMKFVEGVDESKL